MDGVHGGFQVDDGAYEAFAKNIDPLGDDMRGAASNHVAPHVDLAGDGFSMMGGESGFTGAYVGRMKELEERMNKLGGKCGRSPRRHAARATTTRPPRTTTPA